MRKMKKVKENEYIPVVWVQRRVGKLTVIVTLGTGIRINIVLGRGLE